MLKEKTIIVLSDDWGRHPFSCQHIMKRIWPHNRVLWVNTIGYRRIQLNVYDLKRILEKAINWAASFARPDGMLINAEGPKILNPVCLPFGNYPIVRKFNAWSILRLIKLYENSWDWSDSILITTLPTAADVVGQIRAKCAVYYCVDDFTLWPGANGDLIRDLEEKLLSRVDLVIATSDRLLKTRKCPSGKSELLTHGVDVEHFKEARKNPAAAVLKNLKPPIIGYYGLIDERCDLRLVFELADSMKGMTFLLIGEWRVDPGCLRTLENVVKIGPVSYEALPNYLSTMNVLILPYIVDELSVSINPLKLKEYLATGLPVVSTALPEVSKLSPFVRIATDINEFKLLIDESLNQGQPYADEIEIYLKSESWDIKAENFCGAIESILDN